MALKKTFLKGKCSFLTERKESLSVYVILSKKFNAVESFDFFLTVEICSI